ncbi:hypothetical protein F4Y93_04945 [Candidatus Poribacteria bacterium]|nr:hypothetical protein [Candidatus Poribacteria bacterium]
MNHRILLLIAAVLVGCSQETTDRQTAGDNLAEKVIAEKTGRAGEAETPGRERRPDEGRESR